KNLKTFPTSPSPLQAPPSARQHQAITLLFLCYCHSGQGTLSSHQICVTNGFHLISSGMVLLQPLSHLLIVEYFQNRSLISKYNKTETKIPALWRHLEDIMGQRQVMCH
ncbi:hypothetical protein LEMLEM_LOCUS14725, partial [Lemmus lemmus]